MGEGRRSAGSGVLVTRVRLVPGLAADELRGCAPAALGVPFVVGVLEAPERGAPCAGARFAGAPCCGASRAGAFLAGAPFAGAFFAGTFFAGAGAGRPPRPVPGVGRPPEARADVGPSGAGRP
ncbi:hypothetical protein [Antribacter gilvus]|uniref:hypothetical protein n=1 Tax=Antribacter gilvus TaxID=2304675 RepID=UPI000F7A1EF1|nr:hypothetical protein [Antribacter gilvus]